MLSSKIKRNFLFHRYVYDSTNEGQLIPFSVLLSYHLFPLFVVDWPTYRWKSLLRATVAQYAIFSHQISKLNESVTIRKIWAEEESNLRDLPGPTFCGLTLIFAAFRALALLLNKKWALAHLFWQPMES